MPDECDIARDNTELLKEIDEIRTADSQKNTKVVASSEDNDIKMRDYIKKNFAKGETLTESELNKLFNDIYGKKSDRLKLANKINGLMEANESLKGYMNQYIIENTPTGVIIEEYREFEDMEGNKTKRKVTVLSNLSLGSLKNIYAEALTPGKWKESKVGVWGHPMNFDGIVSHIITQKQRSVREPSGAYWIIAKATEDYPTNISSRISDFSSESFAEESHGMNGVYHSISNIKRFMNKPKWKDGKKLTRLFSRYMMGMIYKDSKTGEWMVYEDYMLREDENGDAMKYDTGDYMFGFQNPVELKNYTPPHGKKGQWYVDFNKMNRSRNAEKEFFSLVDNARAIDNKLFKYMKHEMHNSLYGKQGLLAELFESFKTAGLNIDQIKQIFFNPNMKSSKELIKKLDKQHLKKYKDLFATFGSIINDQFVMVNGGKVLFPDEPGFRKNHWPVLYDTNHFPFMLSKLIKELQVRVKSLRLDLKAGVNKKGQPYTSEERSKLKDMIADFDSKISQSKIIKKNRVSYNQDRMGQTIVPFASDNKYFKNISNAYDIRQARSDDGVYYDYLRNSMSAIERNLLSAQLVKALRISASDNSYKMDEVVTKDAINLFKAIFNTPDVNGPFNRIAPKLLGNLNNFNNFLNKNPFRNRTPKQLSNTFRIMNNMLTATYLGGIFTTIQNRMDMYRNIIHFGHEVFHEAKDALTDDFEKPFWERLISMSGITEFSDFFSRSMVNSISEIQLELDVSEGIYGEMIKYWINIDNNMSEDKADAKFRKGIDIYLSQSNSVTKASEIVIEEDSNLTKAMLKDIKQQRKLQISNKLVNLAITKQYIARDAFKRPGFKNKVVNFLKGPTDKTLENYASLFGENTMSDTERFIRSVSFVIGVQRAMQNGSIEGPVDYILKDEKSIRKAIKYGQIHNKVVNFQLSTQSMGKHGQGEIGKFWSKFKVWSNQKFGSDVRIWRNAYRSALSEKRLQHASYNPLAWALTSGKVLATVINPKKKLDRVSDNEMATLRQFIKIQGLTTLSFDIVTLGVFPMLAPLRYAMYLGTGTRALRGFTSDFISFAIAIPLLIVKSLAGGGGDDEDKDLQRTFTYFFRKTQIGFGATWTFDILQMIYYAAMADGENAKDKWLDFTGPLTGGNTVFGKLSKHLQKKMMEED